MIWLRATAAYRFTFIFCTLSILIVTLVFEKTASIVRLTLSWTQLSLFYVRLAVTFPASKPGRY